MIFHLIRIAKGMDKITLKYIDLETFKLNLQHIASGLHCIMQENTFSAWFDEK